ncbi:MAG TPA: prolyl oligopeptidase family serine peptidase [Burkholderiales bacterium]|jgi:dienelactone hydrolase|nr:prolyl oligopeptidase family serine peptidase [Burkholderiales bacterium]
MAGQGRIARAVLLLCALLTGLVATAARAQQEDHSYYGPRLIEEKVRIPAPGGYVIAATILRPDAEGPFGVVVLNHGVSASARERARESSDLLINSAAVFARRGYVVVLPLRRGFGDTGGDMAEDPGSCSNPDYKGAEKNAAEDVMVAYNYARTLPYVDSNRMILAGQSAGGMVSVFTAGTRNPQGLVAVLAFAAGRGGDPDINPGVPCAIEPIARVMDMLGKNIHVPVLFNYSENDLFFSPKVSRGWFDRFNANGAGAEYALQPAFGKDGHYLFGDTLGVRYWLPTVESFLGRHNVVFARLDQTDPERQPLLALDRVPNIKSDACKGLYRAFLESPGPRAYAVSDDGRCGFAGGLQDAKDVAMRQCGNVAKGGCKLYAVDESVIWKENIAGQGAATPAAGR